MRARDRTWQEAGQALTPERSLDRLDMRAGQAVSGVALVGSLLAGFGLLAADKVPTDGLVRLLALATVVVAVLSVAVALAAQVLAVSPAVPRRDLVAVEQWYRRRFRRAWPVQAAGVGVVVAVVLAGATAVLALTAREDPRPVVAVRLTGVGDQARLGGTVIAVGADDGDLLRVIVTGLRGDGGRDVLAQALAAGGGGRQPGVPDIVLDVPGVGGYARVEVAASVAARACTVTFAASGSSTPVHRCT